MPVDQIKILKKYADEGYNILTPYITLDGLMENHKATIETLKLSPNPQDGDVYKDANSSSFILNKHALDKLGLLANIIWPPLVGLQRLDDKKNQDYVAYQAYGAIKKADGVMVPCSASYDIDLDVKAENLAFTYKAKGTKDKKTGQQLAEYVDYCVSRDIRAIREFKVERCESGAKNRVIRALLGLKRAYTKAQLSKPFVSVRINYVPDYNDPHVKQYLLERHLDAQFSLFGSRPNPSSPPQIEQQFDAEAETVMADPIEPDPANGNGIDETEPLDEEVDDFALWDRASQEKHIWELAIRKAYDLKKMLKDWRDVPLSEITDIDLIRVHDHIQPMEDTNLDDDIPF
jgi:hypothetical protein